MFTFAVHCDNIMKWNHCHSNECLQKNQNDIKSYLNCGNDIHISDKPFKACVLFISKKIVQTPSNGPVYLLLQNILGA